jgi:hypothetical protein
MRKANLKSWAAILCLASLARPMAAQQLPANPEAVHKASNQPAPAKPATPAPTAPANQPSTAGSAANQAQTPKAAPPTNSVAKPASAVPSSTPTSAQSAPAKTPMSNATSKPATTSPAKPASALASGSKAGLGTVTKAKPATASAAKLPSGATANSTAKPSTSKPLTAARADVPTRQGVPTLKPIAVRETIARRDPFAPLLGKETSGGGGSPSNLPPGKPGLLISGLRIDGIVSGPNGMIAIVSTAQERVYFLREGDRLYDGQVEHITMDGISFHQSGKDPFGNSVEREVAKRLNSIPGEQQ